MTAATGHELGWKLHPVASVRLRDSGQLGLAQVIVAAAHPTWTPKLETPVAPGDLRAADLLLNGVGGTIHIEIERVLVDVQAQLRSGQVKREVLARWLGRPVQFLLAVPDTRANRDRMAPFTDLLARTLPVSSREAWNVIRTGAPMVGDGILFVRPRNARGA
jgi:hypothetical protein